MHQFYSCLDPEFSIETLFLGNFVSATDNNNSTCEDGMDWTNEEGEYSADEDVVYDSDDSDVTVAEEIMIAPNDGSRTRGTCGIGRSESMNNTDRNDGEAEKNSEIEQILQELESVSTPTPPNNAASVSNDYQNGPHPSYHELFASENGKYKFYKLFIIARRIYYENIFNFALGKMMLSCIHVQRCVKFPPPPIPSQT